MKTGIYYDMHHEIYHNDPCDNPSLSNSIIRPLLDCSPYHAWALHPKLGKEDSFLSQMKKPISSEAMDFGSVIHAMILGKGEQIVPIDALDFKSSRARKEKEEALANGQIPILVHKLEKLYLLSQNFLDQMKENPLCEDFFKEGHSEVSLLWEEKGINCRARIDRLPKDKNSPIYDIKTTSLKDESWAYQLQNKNRTQSEFYKKGISKILKETRPSMRFIICHLDFPFRISIFELSEDLILLAKAECKKAIEIWGDCIKNNKWDDFSNEIKTIRSTPWIEAKYEEKYGEI